MPDSHTSAPAQKQLSQIEYIKGKGNGKREYLNRVAAICESHGATISPLA